MTRPTGTDFQAEGGHGAVPTAGVPAAGPRRWLVESPLWEVFVRSRRGLSHQHVGSLHAADAEMALRNARDVYTRRQEGVSIWVAGGHHGVEPRREGRVLRSCGRQGLPAPHVLRHARRCSTCESGRHVCAAARRRCADSVPPAGRMGSPRAGVRGRHRADQHRLGPARPGAGAAHVRRRRRGAGRSEDDLALARGARLPQRAARGTSFGADDFAFDDRPAAVFSAYQFVLYDELRTSSDEILAAVAAKAVKEVAYHRDYAMQWTLRLGDGTERVATGCKQPRASMAVRAELFDVDDLVRDLVVHGIAIDVAALLPRLGCRR